MNLVQSVFELIERNVYDWKELGFEFQGYYILRGKKSLILGNTKCSLGKEDNRK